MRFHKITIVSYKLTHAGLVVKSFHGIFTMRQIKTEKNLTYKNKMFLRLSLR